MRERSDDELVPIGDPALPDELREHSRRLRPAVAWIVDLGHDEYAGNAADGELLDMINIKEANGS